MMHIVTADGEYIRIEREVWIIRGRHGPLATPHRVKAQGIGDGETIWSLGSLEGYPEARIVTLAEYEEATAGVDPADEPVDDSTALAELLEVLA